jgi:hypothetical protein
MKQNILLEMINQVRFETCFNTERQNLVFVHLGSLDGRSASIDKVSTEQKAYLFRTNYSLFNCAVQLIIDKGLKNVGFVGV